MLPRLKLDLRVNSTPALIHTRRWHGCSVEHVILADHQPLEYSYTGPLHYCALHDLELVEGEVQLEDLSADSRRDLRGTLTYVPAGASVRGWSHPTRRENGFTAFYFDPVTIREELADRYVTAPNAPQLYVRDKLLEGSLQQIQRLVLARAQDELFFETMALSIALQLLQYRAKPGGPALSALQANTVTDYISTHLGHKLSVQELADLTGLSRFHFVRAFKSSTGLAPHQFVLDQRMSRAKELLTQTTQSVEAIALQIGFTDSSQFSKSFSMRVGVPPSVFRNR